MTGNDRKWPLAEAKAKFSELVVAAEKSGPQFVTKRGAATVVVLSLDDYQALLGKPRRTIKDWLLAPEARVDHLPLPARQSLKWRKAPAL